MNASLSTATAKALREPAGNEHVGDPAQLWLSLLGCAALIRQQINRNLRQEFAISIARFELLAQLEHEPDGLKMSEISERMMVSNGNVTALTDQLVADGLVMRHAIPGDRRAHAIRLTAAGREQYAAIACRHRGWMSEMFDGLGHAERASLHTLLGRLRNGMHTAIN